jgi:hypothetical protein
MLPMMSSKAYANLMRRQAINEAAKKPPSKLAKILPPKPKPKFNPKLRDKLELRSRKYGNEYSQTPKDPEILSEMQGSFRGRKELKRAAKNEASGKRLVRNGYIGMSAVMAGAIAVGQYQESERNKSMKTPMPKSKNKTQGPMEKPKAKSKKAMPKKMGK